MIYYYKEIKLININKIIHNFYKKTIKINKLLTILALILRIGKINTEFYKLTAKTSNFHLFFKIKPNTRF